MFYLFLATLCSASIALIFKYTETNNTNRYVITSANYFMAFTVSLFMIFSKDLLSDFRSPSDFFREYPEVMANNSLLFTPHSSMIWGIIIGSIAGFFFFFSFIFYQQSVRENGAGISGTFSKLGILIPMVFSIIIWDEIPTALQWFGIFLALISVVIVNVTPGFSAKKINLNYPLIFLFLLAGMAEFSNKIYQNYALNAYKDVFLFCVFFVAFLISSFFTRKQQALITRSDVLTGFAVGVPNLFSSYFLIMSLDTVKTSVAFPVFSAGSIIFITLGSYLIFKEIISPKNKLAIFFTVIALILINL